MSMTRLLWATRSAGQGAAVLWLLMAGPLTGCGDEAPPPPAGAIDSGGGPRDAGSTPGSGGGASPDAVTPLPDATAATPPGSAPVAVPDAGPGSAATPTANPTGAVAIAPITWGPCPDDMDPELPDVDECGRLKVPLDYTKPAGETIEILVGRIRAKDPARRIGSLFVAAGSPAADGVTGGFLSDMGENLADEILARFDVLSWDPRGVGASGAVDCKGMPSLSEIERTFDLTPQTTQKDALTSAYQRWVEACKANSKMLPHLGVAAAVSDLEILRRALGDEKLTIVAFSYGTNIGLHYLLRYPDRVRAMALDAPYAIWPEDASVIDPDDGFENALKGFFEWCGRASAVDCPFARQNPDRAAAYDELVAAIKTNPLPAPEFPGQLVTAHLLRWSVRAYLYEEAGWPYLGAALEQARMGVGNNLWETVDSFLAPGPGSDAYHAITCADVDPRTAAQVDALAQRMAGGRLALPYRRMSCVGWPVSSLTARPTTVPAIPPVVLIGSTGDPRTPYAWATATAARLPGSTLITAVAYDHTYYAFDEPCIDAPVNAYLLEGTMPPAGIRCEFPDPVIEPKKSADARSRPLPARPASR